MENGICEGCGRTEEEINSWLSYSHEEKMIVMRRLGYAKRRKRNT
jgi:predicted Fe-S protein YdhL (DUF1289 family)